MLDNLLSKIRRLVPAPIFNAFNRPYHWLLAFAAAVNYGFPSKKIQIIAVTGTKGKSSTVEILNAILETAGYKTALSSTIRFKVGDRSWRNLYKMTMPGRFAIQKLIRKALKHECDCIIIEMTSQGALNFRHLFIDMDMFIFTNIAPEHIEAHGSYENYVASKLSICKQLGKSKKPDRTLIINADDAEADRFMECEADKKISYSIHDVEPYEVKKEGLEFSLDGRRVHSNLSGLFNLYNITAAITAARSMDVSLEDIITAVEDFADIAGRVEKIEAKDAKGQSQDFTVIVDYAHTPDSLEKLYQVFRPMPQEIRDGKRLIAVLGGTGGGRDAWKRKEMGRIADTYCDLIILTDEDPYDEDPKAIVAGVTEGIASKKPVIIMDRREAIREAVKRAKKGDAVLITGKGTDPYIMIANNKRIPWSDAKVAREELEKLVKKN
jgi:UDP-N-acetylmuramoyl-L-alanyl-D-glutamate--2,6-diaminopimelate ligase